MGWRAVGEWRNPKVAWRSGIEPRGVLHVPCLPTHCCNLIGVYELRVAYNDTARIDARELVIGCWSTSMQVLRAGCNVRVSLGVALVSQSI